MEFLVGRLITSVLALLLLGSTQAATLVFTTYYHNDHLGSPAAATDERNELLWRAHYRPYGERQENPADTPYGSPGYTGHVQDGSSGLVYMQARYYDPQLGRFLAMDPAGPQEEVPGSFNRYAYGLNNPYRYVDPDGHWAMAVLVGLDIGLTGHGIYSEYQTGGTDAALVEAGKAAAAHVIGLGVGNVLRRGYILAKSEKATVAISESRIGHIFREAEGHLTDTPANRELITKLANDKKSVLGGDRHGNTWAAETLPDGSQALVQYRGNQVINGGTNKTPRTYDSERGLTSLKPRGNKDGE